MQGSEKCQCILVTLLKIQRKYEKEYSWPSQRKILELMDRNQGIKKSRATLNRRLRVGEDEKYVIRRRRIRKTKKYGMTFKSTLYKITIKGYRMLSRFGVDVRAEIEKYEKWREEMNRKDRSEDRIKGMMNENIKKVKGLIDKAFNKEYVF